MLIAVLQLFEDRVLTENEIYPTGFLRQTYSEMRMQHLLEFERDWDKNSPELPFCRIGNDKKVFPDGFWHLSNSENKLPNTPEWNTLAQQGTYVALDEKLYELLQNSDNLKTAKQFLIDTYFSEQEPERGSYPLPAKKRKVDAAASAAAYDPYLVPKGKTSTRESKDRHRKFTEVILKAYNYRCAISGYEIISPKDKHLLDAPHIEPHSINQNNEISNGICLTPNLHRAFDRGLIAIDNDYHVLVKEDLVEAQDLGGSLLKQFIGKKLHLPEDKTLWPDLQKLREHRNRFDF